MGRFLFVTTDGNPDFRLHIAADKIISICEPRTDGANWHISVDTQGWSVPSTEANNKAIREFLEGGEHD